MTYPQVIQYLNSLVNYEKKNRYQYKKAFKLERMKKFLGFLGRPQEGLRCLHIAGTKGKGSTCAFIAYILREAGFRVGLYTSPHLVDVRERIRVLKKPETRVQKPEDELEGMVSRNELIELVEKIRPIIEKYNVTSKYGPLTFFEVLTALAFLYFRERKTDYAVLETGLGGRLDATNTTWPLVCGITPISYEHAELLGKSIKKIAWEKAGIIKGAGCRVQGAGLVVISAPQEREVRKVIRERCLKKRAKLYEVGKDIYWYGNKFNDNLQRFNIKGLKRNYTDLKMQLLGRHQLDNAAQAVGMIEALNDSHIKPSHIRAGLKTASWPGRLEVISRRPLILLDGAQNAASSQVLREAVKDYFKYEKLILVLGMSQDKDIQGICSILYPIADKIILTRAQNPRAAQPELIKGAIRRQTEVTSNVREALILAKKSASSEDLILITGSLFVVGEARRHLRPTNLKP